MLTSSCVIGLFQKPSDNGTKANAPGQHSGPGGAGQWWTGDGRARTGGRAKELAVGWRIVGWIGGLEDWDPRLTVDVICAHQPQEVKDIKKFLEIIKVRKDVETVTLLKVKKNDYKFKARCSKYLYTLKLSNQSKVKILKESLPPGSSLLRRCNKTLNLLAIRHQVCPDQRGRPQEEVNCPACVHFGFLFRKIETPLLKRRWWSIIPFFESLSSLVVWWWWWWGEGLK